MNRLMTIVLLCIATGCANDRATRSGAHHAQHQTAHGQQHQQTTPAAAKSAAKGWGAGLGDYHHPVSTRSAAAQRAFDEGLILVYGFNHDEAIRAFNQNDVDLARQVLRRDDVVDALYHQIVQDMLARIESDGRRANADLSNMMFAKNLERIADHCTNIAEDVIYVHTGRIVRHLRGA